MTRKRVLVLGAHGMLGQALVRRFSDEAAYTLVTAARQDADFCLDFTDDAALGAMFSAARPDIVINAAAITNLAAAERDAGRAYRVNARLAGVLAELCRAAGARLVQVSTDHYYTGDGAALHDEGAPVRLINEYARTKYAGESFALAYDSSLVLRTNIVGFRHQKERLTFVEWALGELQAGRSMRLFDDFYTSSMTVRECADVIVAALAQGLTGLYNVAARHAVTKEQFVVALSEAFFGHPPVYERASVHAMPSSVQRADSLGLDTRKIEAALGIPMPELPAVIASLKEEWQEYAV